MFENLKLFQSIEHLKLKITFSRRFFDLPSNDNMLLSNKNYFGEKNYKYYFAYLNENKIKQLSKIFRKTNSYVESCDGETKWMYF